MAWFDMIYTSELLYVFAFVRAFVHPYKSYDMFSSWVFRVRLFAGCTQMVLASVAIGLLNWQCALAGVTIHLLDWLFITTRLSKLDPHRAAGLVGVADTAIFILSAFSVVNFVFERPTRQSNDRLLLPEHWLGIAVNCIAVVVFLVDYYYVRTWTDAWGCYETTTIDKFEYGYCPDRLGNYGNSEVCRQFQGNPSIGCTPPSQRSSSGIPPTTITPTTYVAYIAAKLVIASSVLYASSLYSVTKNLQLRAMLVCDAPAGKH